MKKTYCCSKREEETFIVLGNLVCDNVDNIFIVTSELTMVCVHSKYPYNIGVILNVKKLRNLYKVYHGSVTMEN